MSLKQRLGSVGWGVEGMLLVQRLTPIKFEKSRYPTRYINDTFQLPRNWGGGGIETIMEKSMYPTIELN